MILVVDDNPLNLDLCTRKLERSGFDVITARSGTEALDMIGAVALDLVLLDIMMPGIDGVEVLKAVRATLSTVELPVIMVTAKDQSSDIVECLQLGANDYVTKPLDFTVLLARVRTQLTLRHAHARLEQTTRELQLRNEFIRELFGRYVSDDVLHELLAEQNPPSLGGALRNLSLLFCDIRGFTSLFEQTAPETIVAILNNHYNVMFEILHQYQGTVLEIMGDGLVAVFGAPVANPEHARHAVECALAMQKAMHRVNAWNRAKGVSQFEIGIGIHTGDAVIGNIGSEKRMKFDVTGPAVSLASRIESYSTGGQVLISEHTLAAVGQPLRIDRCFEARPQGMKQALLIHQVGGIASSPELSRSLPTPPHRAFVEPVDMEFSVVENKYVSEQRHHAGLNELSSDGGIAQCDEPIAGFATIMIHRIHAGEVVLHGPYYAKIVAYATRGQGEFGFTFTSLSNRERTAIRNLVESGKGNGKLK